MKIVADSKIPFLRGVFEPQATVVYLPGVDIRSADLADADCLLVRTRTRCTRDLLQGTSVRFIGTATIGFDHIDTEWCHHNGITWTNAPGCNSGSVVQYIVSAILSMADRLNFRPEDKTLGIIGVGHVGKKVGKAAHEMGMKVILNDPPRARAEGPAGFSDLNELLAVADIVTIHVPLNLEGPDRTIDLVGRNFLDQLRPGAILINSSRGEVLDEKACLAWMNEHARDAGAVLRNRLSLILDVWPHEPEINRELLGLAAIATPHIAGYSMNGKYNATRMIAEAVAEFFHLKKPEMPPLMRDGSVAPQEGTRAPYDIMADDRRLRESPETFEEQRNHYPQRWEFL
jgi:erythronate-4-phosphate dehydrogenase